MSFRLRRSIQIVPGVRFNVSKTGVGLGVGPRGLRYTVHSSGRRTFTARSGVPGVYWQEQHQRGSRRQQPRQSPRTVAPSLPKPGLFASKGEKALYKAILGQAAPSVVAKLGDDYSDYRTLAYSIAGLQMINDDHPQATRLLATAFGAGVDPAVHPFARKYLATELELAIAAGVTVHLPINRDAVGLALAELYQADGNPAQAIDTVEQLEPTAYAAVSLAELYLQVERYGDVVELTEGITNQDDATALLLVFRAAAFREQSFYDAAHETFKEALRSRSRAPEIRHLALFERSRNFLAQGKKAPARKDLERILAEDSTYEGVRQQLAELTGTGPPAAAIEQHATPPPTPPQPAAAPPPPPAAALDPLALLDEHELKRGYVLGLFDRMPRRTLAELPAVDAKIGRSQPDDPSDLAARRTQAELAISSEQHATLQDDMTEEQIRDNAVMIPRTLSELVARGLLAQIGDTFQLTETGRAERDKRRAEGAAARAAHGTTPESRSYVFSLLGADGGTLAALIDRSAAEDGVGLEEDWAQFNLDDLLAHGEVIKEGERYVRPHPLRTA